MMSRAPGNTSQKSRVASPKSKVAEARSIDYTTACLDFGLATWDLRLLTLDFGHATRDFGNIAMPPAVAKKSSTPLFVFLGCAVLLMMGLMLVLAVFVIRQINAGTGMATAFMPPEEPEDKAGGL